MLIEAQSPNYGQLSGSLVDRVIKCGAHGVIVKEAAVILKYVSICSTLAFCLQVPTYERFFCEPDVLEWVEGIISE